jgi:Cytochrome oxidase complex assembly protein 1
MNQVNYGAPPQTEQAGPRKTSRFRLPLPGAIALGCLGLLVVGALAIGGLFVVITSAMRSSDAYQLALAAAQRDPAVVAELGAPVSPGWLTMGQIEVSGPGGRANLSIPISGPRGSGKIEAQANKAGGKWTFSRLAVQVEGRSTPVDLLAPAATASSITGE